MLSLMLLSLLLLSLLLLLLKMLLLLLLLLLFPSISESAQAEEMIGPKNWIWVQQQIQLIKKGQTMIVTVLIDLPILRSPSEVFKMTPFPTVS